MNHILELTEYSSAPVDLTTAQAADLVRAAGTCLSVSPTSSPGTYTISSTSHVGSVVMPFLSVHVRPKVRIENLFALMDAGMPDQAWREEDFGYATLPDLLAVFAAFFARAVDRATARGLLRSYRPEQDRLPALRGRIDFAEQLRQPALPAPIACRFDEFTPDVAENRYLVAAVDRLLRVVGVPPKARSHLLQVRSRFEDVLPVLPSPADLDALQYTRLNEHYRPPLRLARFVVENLTLLDRAGQIGASSFTLDMNKLFEEFIARRLASHLAPDLQVLAQTSRKLDRGGKVTIEPDLEVHRFGSPVYVADTKYKLTWSGLARSSDYYQLLAYCTALDLPEGALIYGHHEGSKPDTTVTVRHLDTRLATYQVDLSGGIEQLEASVEGLCAWVAARSPGALPSPALQLA